MYILNLLTSKHHEKKKKKKEMSEQRDGQDMIEMHGKCMRQCVLVLLGRTDT